MPTLRRVPLFWRTDRFVDKSPHLLPPLPLIFSWWMMASLSRETICEASRSGMVCGRRVGSVPCKIPFPKVTCLSGGCADQGEEVVAVLKSTFSGSSLAIARKDRSSSPSDS